MNNLLEVTFHDWIEFDYVNWRGEKGHRRTEVNMLYFGSTEYHPEEQWLLDGFDLDKSDFRTFAMKDMSNVKIIER
ncbi:hypothetical protein M3649_03830 [Ureibacillus chungkukjangi]|nr:hypothetical protein [Ureibacillus chungkukjangi]